MAIDGGQVYTAGKCGLVPAMVEQYEGREEHQLGLINTFIFFCSVVEDMVANCFILLLCLNSKVFF